MHWILWTLLLFQGRPVDFSMGSNPRGIESQQRDDFERQKMIDNARTRKQNSAAEAAHRAQAAVQEKQFRDRYNRLMKAMAQFADSYNNRHTVDAKLLRAVKQAWQDLQKHDALFRTAERD